MRQIHIFYNCFRIYKDLHIFAAFEPKIVFVIVSEQFCTHMLQFCANLHKYWNNAMSNDGSSIEIIDQSHGDLAVMHSISFS
jgi:hypothetical protein